MENNKIIYRTFITTMQMLRDRNYSEGYILSISKNQIVNISKLIDMSFNDFMLSFGKDNALEIDYSKLIFIFNKQLPNNKIYISWFEEDKIDQTIASETIKKIEKLYSSDKDKVNRAIFILKNKNVLTPSAKKILTQDIATSEAKHNIIIDIFLIQELIINITEHKFVPKHIVLSEEEKNLFLSKTRIKPTQLPKIQLIDPVCKYLGVSKGDVIKIQRLNTDGTVYISYRYTV